MKMATSHTRFDKQQTRKSAVTDEPNNPIDESRESPGSGASDPDVRDVVAGAPADGAEQPSPDSADEPSEAQDMAKPVEASEPPASAEPTDAEPVSEPADTPARAAVEAAKPDEAESKSEKAESKSEKAESKPDEAEPKPDEVESKPDEAESKPDEAESKPKKADPKPKKAKSKPKKAKSKPKKAEPKPEKAEPKPEKAESKPEKAEPKSDNMDWYILKIQSNREESIREGLVRRVAIAGLDYYFGDVIVPTEKVTEFKAGKKRVTKRKLYPGYLVVHMEINDDTWFLVRETPGIGDFTGAAGHPTPMLPHEVARIVAKQEEKHDEAPKLKIAFTSGDHIKITEGTFENFEGEVHDIDETNGRVTVMINIFGRSTPVELEYWQIESV